jgi:hypothetical protein
LRLAQGSGVRWMVNRTFFCPMPFCFSQAPKLQCFMLARLTEPGLFRPAKSKQALVPASPLVPHVLSCSCRTDLVEKMSTLPQRSPPVIDLVHPPDVVASVCLRCINHGGTSEIPSESTRSSNSPQKSQQTAWHYWGSPVLVHAVCKPQ